MQNIKITRNCFVLFSLIFVAACASTPYQKGYDSVGSSSYVDIREFCKTHNMEYSYDTIDDIVRIFSSDSDVRIALNSFVVYNNGAVFQLKNRPFYSRGIIYLPRELEDSLFKETIPCKLPFVIKTIVIDPGHGGRDPGAISHGGLKEKYINLYVSRYLQKELQKKGFNAILTRNRDVFLELEERVDFARRKDADLFISIHSNANHNSSQNGVEIYYFSPFTKDNKSLVTTACANAFHTVFKDLGFTIKFPKRARYYVLKNAAVPAVLVEIGYLTNRYEERVLRKQYYQKQLAQAIALGVESLNKRYVRLAGK